MDGGRVGRVALGEKSGWLGCQGRFQAVWNAMSMAVPGLGCSKTDERRPSFWACGKLASMILIVAISLTDPENVCFSEQQSTTATSGRQIPHPVPYSYSGRCTLRYVVHGPWWVRARVGEQGGLLTSSVLKVLTLDSQQVTQKKCYLIVCTRCDQGTDALGEVMSGRFGLASISKTLSLQALFPTKPSWAFPPPDFRRWVGEWRDQVGEKQSIGNPPGFEL